MKRSFFLVIILVASLIFTSCKKSVSMEKLAEYQNGNFSAEAVITISDFKYSAIINKKDDAIYLSFLSPENVSPFIFEKRDKKLSLSVHGLEIPLSESSAEKFAVSQVIDLFSFPVSGIWKIEEKNISGVNLYLCRSDGATLYIDKNSLLPIKITSDNIEIDIISFRTSAE